MVKGPGLDGKAAGKKASERPQGGKEDVCFVSARWGDAEKKAGGGGGKKGQEGGVGNRGPGRMRSRGRGGG